MYKKLNGLLLRECLVLFEVLREVSFVAVLKDEVEIIGSFFNVVQFDNVAVVAGLQDLDLVLK